MSEKKGEGTPENQGKSQENKGQEPKWVVDYPFIKNKESGDLLERVPWGFVE
jgi:hypothetical protein